MSSKKILFLSAIDFKDKSIQVIKKTPLAYANAGWDVDYIVARDNSPNGNYYYEKEINPPGLNIIRFYWQLSTLKSKLPRPFALLINKLASFLVIFRLYRKAVKQVRKNKYDVIYGYEFHGVLAMKLLGMFYKTTAKKVSRFQGTFLFEMVKAKAYNRLLFNADLILAIKTKTDLLIMTDDGTQGDRAINHFRRADAGPFVFWTNGVANFTFDSDLAEALKKQHELEGKKVFISISRLIGWKKVDRGIRILKAFKEKSNTDFKYLIVGEGDSRPQLEKLVKELELDNEVVFIGAVNNTQVNSYLSLADFFISMYDSSNVGNPLLEAIRANKIVVTLNNGDTGSWIKHKQDGLIYNPDTAFFEEAAGDIAQLCDNTLLFENMKKEVKLLEEAKLYTWDERFRKEIDLVTELVNTNL